MSVSRSLKMLCGTDRPSDWFSQKSCAGQYGKLLENVETPKRKKRTGGERDSCGSVDTPGESIVRNLAQERIAELKSAIEEDNREYSRLMEECRALADDDLDDATVLKMWEKIENENREKEREQQKHAQWLKEREERKLDMDRVWRPMLAHHHQQQQNMSPSSNNSNSSTGSMTIKSAVMIKQEEIDSQESCGEPIYTAAANTNTNVKPGTSPLLTSLLKLPSTSTTAIPATTTSATAATTTVASPSINNRSSAPTITTLLTTGQVSGQTSSNIVSPSPTSTFFPASFHMHPHHQHHNSSQQPPPTPSQAAPTLSKLLDKTQPQHVSNNNISYPSPSITAPINTADATNDAYDEVAVKLEHMEEAIQQQQKQEGSASGQDKSGAAMAASDEEEQLLNVFKEFIPEDLTEYLSDDNDIIDNPELLAAESASVESVHPAMREPSEVSEKMPEDEENVGSIQCYWWQFKIYRRG